MTKTKIIDNSTMYVQEVGMTYAQKVAMYKKCSKKELIEMLIASNNHLEQVIVPYAGPGARIYHTYKKIPSG